MSDRGDLKTAQIRIENLKREIERLKARKTDFKSAYLRVLLRGVLSSTQNRFKSYTEKVQINVNTSSNNLDADTSYHPQYKTVRKRLEIFHLPENLVSAIKKEEEDTRGEPGQLPVLLSESEAYLLADIINKRMIEAIDSGLDDSSAQKFREKLHKKLYRVFSKLKEAR